MNRTSMFVALVTVFAVGCANAETNDSSESEDNLTTAVKAEVKTVPFKKTEGKCTIDSSSIEVKLANANVAKLINDALEPSFTQFLQDAECATNEVSLEGGQTVSFNDKGLLSITLAESVFAAMAAHPSHSLKTKTFDLATGKQIQLGDAIDRLGLEAIAAGCKTSLTDPDAQELINEACDASVQTTEFGSPTYVVEAGGIRIHPTSLPHVAFAFAAEGALIPWTALNGHIRLASFHALTK